jgi:putative copper resistance protein D
VAIEAFVAAAIVMVASQLAQTIPARHDAIFWWLPFRWSIDATWDDAVTQVRVAAGATALLGALALMWRARNRCREWLAASMIALAIALALPALSVPAYPDTYRKPSVPYQTVSVASGERLFAANCVSCHGRSAHGDGPQVASLKLPPADLTEPHTALHTAGDLFWWLTHGKPPGTMPGFGATLSEDDRWDLINFLRTLSLGYQARVLTDRIVARRPWLPAIDFGYTTAAGTSGSLKDWRSRNAVLLVFYSEPGSNARLAQLRDALPQLRASQVEALAVPVDRAGRDTGLPMIVDGAAETMRAYALLRRTLSTLDARDRAPVPEHMEFLIDRFGYIRARWLPGETTGWRDIERLLAQARALADEPQLRPPPDDHVH